MTVEFTAFEMLISFFLGRSGIISSFDHFEFQNME